MVSLHLLLLVLLLLLLVGAMGLALGVTRMEQRDFMHLKGRDRGTAASEAEWR
jgi:hypothetical protein